MNKKKIKKIFKDWASEQIRTSIRTDDDLDFLIIDGHVDVEDFVNRIEKELKNNQ